MTQTLERAWETLISLPEDRQEIIANIILDEIQDELHWDNQFSKSEQELRKLANNVRDDIISGKYIEKGFGEL
jgi:hypothetical protein